MNSRMGYGYGIAQQPAMLPAHKHTDYRALYERNSCFASIKFLYEVSEKMKLKPTTASIAATLFHRVQNNLNMEYDKLLIATSCLYLASKVNEDHCRIKELILVRQVTLDRESALNNMANESWISSIKDAIIQAEMLVMRVLHFDPSVVLPHKYLLSYISTLENWLDEGTISETPIAKCAICLLQDFYHNPNIVSYEPDHIAVAVLALTLQIYGLKIPGLEEPASTDTWFKLFVPDMSIEQVWEIIDQILKTNELEMNLQND